MSHELETRVALLEHISDAADEDIKGALEVIVKHMEEEDEKWETIKTELQAVKSTVAKYKSFLGGVVFTVSALWGIFLVAIKSLGWFANGN